MLTRSIFRTTKRIALTYALYTFIHSRFAKRIARLILRASIALQSYALHILTESHTIHIPVHIERDRAWFQHKQPEYIIHVIVKESHNA